MIPVEIIKKKRDHNSLTKEEIEYFISNFNAGQIPDYQMAALLMAVFLNGMTNQETLHLTQTMLHSGAVLNHDNIKGKKVDKHSTGGVGDKTSLILAPIVAACGVAVPMISGRGLGHSGGTLDKLESIPGFSTQLDLVSFKKMLEKIGVSLIGQTKEICPADKKIYALRDVIGTVENLPLICSSIMSKKLAEGIDGLVLDVKYGSGAFMKTLQAAEQLALALKNIGEGFGKKVVALLTDMNQPLGAFSGNAVEVYECYEILKGNSLLNSSGFDLYSDTRELSLQLSAYMLWISDAASSFDAGYSLALKTLQSGKALEKFEEVVKAQGGDLQRLPTPPVRIDVLANKKGYISAFETEQIGMIGIKIKMGRTKLTDTIDPVAGFQLHKKIGDFVDINEPIISLLGSDRNTLENVLKETQSTITISNENVTPLKLINKVLI